MRASRPLCLGLAVAGLFCFALLALTLTPAWMPHGVTLHPATPQQVLTPKQLARTDHYVHQQRPVALASYFVGLAVTLVVGLTPPAARLAGRLRGWWWVRIAVATAAMTLLPALVTLPLSLLYRSRALDAGLTRQSLTGWFQDWGTGLRWAWSARPSGSPW